MNSAPVTFNLYRIWFAKGFATEFFEIDAPSEAAAVAVAREQYTGWKLVRVDNLSVSK